MPAASNPPEFEITGETETPVVRLRGDWTLANLGDAGRRLSKDWPGDDARLDLTQVGRLDTAGAFAVIQAAGGALPSERVEAREENQRLIELVAEAAAKKPKARKELRGWRELTVRLGKGVVGTAYDAFDTLVFAGHLLIVFGKSLVNPLRIRWAPVFSL
ncbi:MAG: ABC transporter permease, partial [Pseudomonadota bacterium]